MGGPLATLAASAHSPARPRGGFRPYAAIDLAFLAALSAVSGGAVSQVRYALTALPVAAAFLGNERDTPLALLASLSAWLAVALLHPGTTAADGGYVLAQTLALGWRGGLALALAFVLGGWRRRLTALAASRQELIAQAQDAEERARRRLAYSLHDGPVQNLLGARLELGHARRGDHDSIGRVDAALVDTVAQLRDAIFELHPHTLDEIGLPAALRQLAEKKAGEGAMRVRVDVDPEAEGRHDALVFSLARELLSNAAKHAHAAEVCLELRCCDGELELGVHDDGHGFDTGRREAARREGHIGLAASAERVEAAGGHMSIASATGGGTRVRVVLPTASDGPSARANGGQRQATRRTAGYIGTAGTDFDGPTDLGRSNGVGAL